MRIRDTRVGRDWEVPLVPFSALRYDTFISFVLFPVPARSRCTSYSYKLYSLSLLFYPTYNAWTYLTFQSSTKLQLQVNILLHSLFFTYPHSIINI